MTSVLRPSARRSPGRFLCVRDPVPRRRTTLVTDEWVINGQKAWATNGGIADIHVVIATVDPSLGTKGQAAFVEPKSEVRGLEQGTKLRKNGLRASHTADVFFDNVRIPASNVLGRKEKLDERLARARSTEGRRGTQRLDGHLRDDPPHRRRPGDRHRAGCL